MNIHSSDNELMHWNSKNNVELKLSSKPFEPVKLKRCLKN